MNFLLTKFTPKAGQIYPRLGTPALEQYDWWFASLNIVLSILYFRVNCNSGVFIDIAHNRIQFFNERWLCRNYSNVKKVENKINRVG